MPPLLTQVARVSDGLPLVATMTPQPGSPVSSKQQQEAKSILRSINTQWVLRSVWWMYARWMQYVALSLINTRVLQWQVSDENVHCFRTVRLLLHGSRQSMFLNHDGSILSQTSGLSIPRWSGRCCFIWACEWIRQWSTFYFVVHVLALNACLLFLILLIIM